MKMLKKHQPTRCRKYFVKPEPTTQQNVDYLFPSEPNNKQAGVHNLRTFVLCEGEPDIEEPNQNQQGEDYPGIWLTWVRVDQLERQVRLQLATHPTQHQLHLDSYLG